jgi:TonB family protein
MTTFRFLKMFGAASLACAAVLSGTFIQIGKAQQPNPLGKNDERDAGIKLYQQDDTKGAIAKLRAAARKRRDDPEVWYYLGLALTRKGEIKDAGKAFESALKAEPNFVNAHAGLAFILLLRNKLPDALSEGQRALKGNPNLVDAHYIVGVVRLRTGETAKAFEEANTAIRINPQYARAYLLKSQALVALSDETHSEEMPRDKLLLTYKDAVASLEKYLQLSANKTTDETWREQLEALKSTADLLEKTGRTILRSGEVTERARVLSKPEPSYTDSARQNAVTGTVVLRAVFAADGKVKHLSVITGLPDGLTERALAAARAIKFVPAKKDGRPVSMWMQLEYNFNLY